MVELYEEEVYGEEFVDGRRDLIGTQYGVIEHRKAGNEIQISHSKERQNVHVRCFDNYSSI